MRPPALLLLKGGSHLREPREGNLLSICPRVKNRADLFIWLPVDAPSLGAPSPPVSMEQKLARRWSSAVPSASVQKIDAHPGKSSARSCRVLGAPPTLLPTTTGHLLRVLVHSRRGYCSAPVNILLYSRNNSSSGHSTSIPMQISSAKGDFHHVKVSLLFLPLLRSPWQKVISDS